MSPPTPAVPVTVVVPCFNEEACVVQLVEALDKLRQAVFPNYELHVLCVDDGSTDRTRELLEELFQDRPRCRVVTLPKNQGITAATLAGIRHATTDIVAAIDSDCSYDPLELVRMLPLLEEHVDVVTASPYHPAGNVEGVPAWRLALSKAASWLYRRVTRLRLYTFTSCFRIYRREAVLGITVRHPRHDGIAELLARMSLQGSTIVEHPATLSVRRLGRSKMRLMRTIVGHLRILAELAVLRGVSPSFLTPYAKRAGKMQEKQPV